MSLLNNKFLFVHINKSGGGVITTHMRNNGDTKIVNYHRTLNNMLNIASDKYELKKKDLYIFTIVRNPWERMLSMYLFYHKNNYNSPEFFSGNNDIDNDFNKWIEYIYSDNFDRTRIHSAVNIFDYCFSNQLNWISDKNGNIININKILRFENNELYDFFKNTMKLKNINTNKKIHPTKHNHYCYYYNNKSIELVKKHYSKDIEYFNYNFENLYMKYKIYKNIFIHDIKSYSQAGQEKFVINLLNYKKNGIFIEVGGMDGIRHSNTYLLENKYNWNGILIEASPVLYNKLKYNRKCFTENVLLNNDFSNNVEYLYIKNEKGPDGLQGIINNYELNHLQRIKKELNETNTIAKILKMNTIPIQVLFDKYKLYNIDYFSLDVEGSELQILKGIDFDKTNINIFGIEINYEYSEKCKNIINFLINKGYKIIKKSQDYFFKKI